MLACSFKRGLLSEAALALEAEVQAHPQNAEAWRLLGTVQAENDDDRQAIAALGEQCCAEAGSHGAADGHCVAWQCLLCAARLLCPARQGVCAGTSMRRMALLVVCR